MVEIYFYSRPSENTIEALKVLRWRFFGKKACWHNRYDSENVQLAIKLCGEAQSKKAETIDYYIGPVEVLVVTSIRSTDVKEIKDLLGSKSNKEYKHDFIIEKNLYDKLRRHQFDFERIWVTSPDNAFSVIKNCGEKIKKRGY